MRDIITVIKYFPIELLFIMFIIGLGAGGITGDLPLMLQAVLFGAVIIGIGRGWYHLHKDGAEQAFADSEAPDFESESGAVDPWQITMDQLVAARRFPPESPAFNADALSSLSKLLDSINVLCQDALYSEAESCALPAEARMTLGMVSAAMASPCATLRTLSAHLSRGAVTEDAPLEYEPSWPTAQVMPQWQAALMLADLTQVMQHLTTLTNMLGFDGANAFLAHAAKIDSVRNHYGLIEINPVTGAWPKIPPVDYSQLVGGSFNVR